MLEVAEKLMKLLKSKGASDSQIQFSESEKHELSIEGGKLSLFRTLTKQDLNLKAIFNGRYSSLSINQISDDDLETAANQLTEQCQSSPEDPARALADKQPKNEFQSGPMAPNQDLMFERLMEFKNWAKENSPKTIIETAVVEYNISRSVLVNTKGIEFHKKEGGYGFGTMFASKDNGKTTSFNYTQLSSLDLAKAFHDSGLVRDQILESAAQLNHKPIGHKFKGEILISPSSLNEVWWMFGAHLTGPKLIDGTSLLKDKMDQQVLSPMISLWNRPTDAGSTWKEFVTPDGYQSSDFCLIANGVLKNFALDDHSARKVGKARSPSSCAHLQFSSGDKTKSELLGNIKEGLLLGRISGGAPGSNGDFSGVAKNSFYVKDGEIQFAVSEVMISGNIFEILNQITGISKEQVDFGSRKAPWIAARGITVS